MRFEQSGGLSAQRAVSQQPDRPAKSRASVDTLSRLINLLSCQPLGLGLAVSKKCRRERADADKCPHKLTLATMIWVCSWWYSVMIMATT